MAIDRNWQQVDMDEDAMPGCQLCNDTGNDATTGYQHLEYDELGCNVCDSRDHCCRATFDAGEVAFTHDGKSGHALCDRCHHPIVKVRRPVLTAA